MARIQLSPEQHFDCAGDDTILRAGLRAGFGMPYECNIGCCGTCKVELLSGTVEAAWAAAPGLGERDRAKNRVLACQSHPTSDCAIKVRLRPENVPAHRPARFRATLESTRDLTHDLREFRFRAAGGAPGFLPGQYALFRLPGVTGFRTYSMANVDAGDGVREFMVKRMPGGVGTATLFDSVPVGSSLELDGPYGLAYLRKEAPRDLLCLAGGSGLAPILSVVRGASREPALADRQMHVFYGARTPRDICGEAELGALPGYGTRIHFQPVVSNPEAGDGWTGPTGFVHEHVKSKFGDRFKEFECYFAGPPAMAQAVQQMFIEARVPYPQVHFDSFY